MLLVCASIFVFAACEVPQPSQPTITFPTAVPTDVPGTATPRLTGACTLLTPQDITEVLGIGAAQASASPLSCGYASGSRTVQLTLLGQSVWDTYVQSFSASDSPQEVGAGDQSLYFPATLGGLVMTRRGEEVYLLSGIGTAEHGAELMNRILAHTAQEETG